MALKDKYFTISEATKELNVTRQTISRWIKEGKLHGEKIGRETLIDKEECRKYRSQRLLEAVDDSIFGLYKGIIEQYCREKGYWKPDVPIEFQPTVLSDQERAEVLERVKRIVEVSFKKFPLTVKKNYQQFGTKVSPPKKKKGGKTSKK